MICLCLLYYLFAGTSDFPIVFTLSDYVKLCKKTGDWSKENSYLNDWMGRPAPLENQAQAWATLTLYRSGSPSFLDEPSRQLGTLGFNWNCINGKYATSITWEKNSIHPVVGGEKPLVGPLKSHQVSDELVKRMEKALGITRVRTFNFPLGV